MCVLSRFFFNYFNPKHLPENNISLHTLWNKVHCGELGSRCVNVVTSVLAVRSSGSPASPSETRGLWPRPGPADAVPAHPRALWSTAGHRGL